MISYPLYLAAYPIGHLIHFQLEQHFRGRNLATEIDRIYRIGHCTPQVWMQKAVGSPLSAHAIIAAAKEAAAEVGKGGR
jgi:hypothetical protein